MSKPTSTRQPTSPVTHCDPKRKNPKLIDFTEAKLFDLVCKATSNAEVRELESLLSGYNAGLIAVWWVDGRPRSTTVKA